MPIAKHHEAQGYDQKPLPWGLWENTRGSDHLALVFPGYGYHADLPVLYYPALQFFSTGADVARLEKRYNEVRGFMDLPDGEQDAWIAADAAAMISECLKRGKYNRLTLVGKSLGTISMAQNLETLLHLERVACIWLTPVLTHPAVVRQLKEASLPGIFAVGTDDQFYDPELVSQLKARQNLTCLVFRGADHSLEVKGDVPATIRCMEELVDTIAKFNLS